MMFIISQLIIIGLAYIFPIIWNFFFKPKDKKLDNFDTLPDYDSLD